MATPSTTGASILIIPVEVQARELDAKLLLSCVAAERGFPVLLGSRAFVHYLIPFLPRGVYLAKSMRSLSEKMFRLLRGLGHQIVAWDEEGLVRFPSPDYYRRRLSPTTLREVSMLFAWGQDDAQLLRDFPASNGVPIHVTGNPRIDLMRDELRSYFDPEVAALRARYGSFILINTNFSFVNNFVSSLNLLLPSPEPGGEPRLGPNTAGMTAEFARGMFVHKQALFSDFKALIPTLSEAFPDRTIIVRPHPSERHDTWREIADHHANVQVVHEGNVISWLIAARLLVHNGCTTAVESAVVGTPVIAYQPARDDQFDFPLPNSLSHRASTAEQVLNLARAVVDGRLGALSSSERAAILERHLNSLRGPLAVDRIMQALEEAGYLDGRPARPNLGRFLRTWVAANTRTAAKLAKMLRPDHRNSWKFHAHRFPGITAQELQDRIGRFGRLLGRFGDLRARPVLQHVFRIERSA